MSDVLDKLDDPEFQIGSQEDFERWFETLSDAEKNDLAQASEQMRGAGPVEGPQRRAFIHPAKVLGYGGGAGGGKSGLICILALVAHQKTVCFRSDGNQMRGMIDDLVQFAGTSLGLNNQQKIFRFSTERNHFMEWGGLSKPGSEMEWRGRAHDLLAADEVTEIQEGKLRFLKTWLRSVNEKQRTRVVYTFNPPGRPDDATGTVADGGAWVRDFFGPWVDPRHPNPAMPGEIRYFATNHEGEDVEVPDATPVEFRVKDKVFVEEPESRSFIPALVGDNPYLSRDYVRTLLSLPEPARSQMLLGDFTAGIEDSEWQVIPTSWIDEAMDRWEPSGRKDRMSAIGVDVARGGISSTVLARRHGFWWDNLIVVPGRDTRTGHEVVTHVMKAMRDGCEIDIDATAVGASPYDIMRSAGYRVEGILGARREGLDELEKSLRLYNLRSWLYWVLRKVLDPSNGLNASLPRNRKLKSQLMAPRFMYTTGKLQVETKDDIKARLGYSPDESDAVALSCYSVLREIGGHRLKPTRPAVDLRYLNRASEYRDYGGQGWMAA